MLARKFNSLGSSRCPRPCRARNATLRPSSSPRTNASEGSPNGVVTRSSRTFVSPGMAYKPLPPIIPISAFFKCPAPLSRRCPCSRIDPSEVYRCSAACVESSPNDDKRTAPVRERTAPAVLQPPAICIGPSGCTLTMLSRSLRASGSSKPSLTNTPVAGDRKQHIALVGRINLLLVIRLILLPPHHAGVLARNLRGIDPQKRPRRIRILPARVVEQPKRSRRLLLRLASPPICAAPHNRCRHSTPASARRPSAGRQKAPSEYAHPARPSRPRHTAYTPRPAADEYPAAAAPAPDVCAM